MTNISYCVAWAQGGNLRMVFNYTLPVHNPEEVEREIKRMGYVQTAVIPWEMAKAWNLWSKLLWKLSLMEENHPRRKALVNRAMQIEKHLIVKYNKLLRS